MSQVLGSVGRPLPDPLETYLTGADHQGTADWQVWTDAHAGSALAFQPCDNGRAGSHELRAGGPATDRIVFEGVIHNRPSLCERLGSSGVAMSKAGTAELLLELYRREGIDFIERLQGSFVLAIWDAARGELHCARDPVGVKRLYWTRADGRFLFASRVKLLLRMPGVHPVVERRALARHLMYVWCPAPWTAFRGIAKLRPGHRMVIDRSGDVVRDEPYTRWEYTEDSGAGPRDRAEETRQRLFRAVGRQLSEDRPFGLYLSGGMDSSAVAAACRRIAPDRPIVAYCGIPGHGEGFASDWPYARQVARHLAIELHGVPVHGIDLDRLGTILWHLEEPLADPAIDQVDLIASAARDRGLQLLLSGAGGDEVFGGHRRAQLIALESLRLRIPSPIRSVIARAGGRLPVVPPFVRRLRKATSGFDLSTRSRIASLFEWLPQSRVAALLGDDSCEDLREELAARADALPAGVHAVNRLLHAETQGFLNDLNLTYLDAITSAHGLELGVPLLDADLMRHANRLPARDKSTPLQSKQNLRRAVGPLLPPSIARRPKSGFGAPLRDWMAGPMRSTIEARLSPSHLKQRGWFDGAAVQSLWKDTLEGVADGTYSLWSVITIDLWAEQFSVGG